jgi:hypothetical protein
LPQAVIPCRNRRILNIADACSTGLKKIGVIFLLPQRGKTENYMQLNKVLVHYSVAYNTG